MIHGKRGVFLFLVALGAMAAQFGGPPLHAQPKEDTDVEVLPPLIVPPPAPAPPPVRDRIFEIPGFVGGFHATGLRAIRNVPGTASVTTRTLTFTGTANDAAGEGAFIAFFPPFSSGGGVGNGIGGPGGPYPITTIVSGTAIGGGNFALDENTELSGQIQANFPGAFFLNGIGSEADLSVLFNYLQSLNVITPGSFVFVNLPNPSSGGLVGRNRFFEDGTPVPHDHVYFFHNHVGSYRGLGTPLDINRYVFGLEKTFLDQMFSIELRVPFAGTASSTQAVGQEFLVDNVEFGNLGVVLKAAIFRTPTLLVSAGLGLSTPTADDTRLLLGGLPVLEIQNRAVLFQPLFGIAWAPTERLYAQVGAQFDFDPIGNPVQALSGAGIPYRAGVWHDRSTFSLSAASGFWAYLNPAGLLSGLALQTELHYDVAFGENSTVRDGSILVGAIPQRPEVLQGTAGVIAVLGQRVQLAVGASFPLAGDRLFDWTLTAQLTTRFGPGVP